jgi:DNA-binding response OmpR family regulator
MASPLIDSNLNIDVKASPHILIVEDDSAQQMLLTDLLQGEGYQTTCVASGTAALQVIATTHVDLILLDLRLPDTDGFTICEQIRADKHKQVPILMLSGCLDPREALQAFHVGATDYLRKPFDVEQLLIHIRAHLPDKCFDPSWLQDGTASQVTILPQPSPDLYTRV